MRSLAILLCVSSLFAQTYVVDSNGGGNFTDLPQAIAAVPSGATLYVRGPGRPGYSPFTIQNKSLTIVGESGSNVVMTGSVTIGPLGASDSVRISGLALAPSWFASQFNDLHIHNCVGQVVVDDLYLMQFIYLSPVCVEVLNSSNVHLSMFMFRGTFGGAPSQLPSLAIRNSVVEVTRSSIIGFAGSSTNGLGHVGGTAIDIAQQSVVTLVSCIAVGGRGGQSTSPGLPSPMGGIGLRVSGGSIATIYGRNRDLGRVSIEGGSPGYRYVPPINVVDGVGGFGLVVEQGSSVRVLGIDLVGGPTPFGGTPGSPFVSDSTSQLSYDPRADTPGAFLAGTVAPLTTVDYTLCAAPGTPAALLVGYGFVAQTPTQLGLGMLSVVPTAMLGPFVVPQNGKLAVPSFVPASWPQGLIVGAQFVTFDAVRNQFEVSNSFTATSR